MSQVRVDIQASSRYPVNRGHIKRVIERVYSHEKMTTRMSVSVLVVGKRKMKMLNRKYHDEDFATDVLSFPYTDPLSNQDKGKFVLPPSEEEVPVMGDLIICYPVAIEQAREKQMLVDEVIEFLVEHGMQHILGKHHD